VNVKQINLAIVRGAALWRTVAASLARCEPERLNVYNSGGRCPPKRLTQKVACGFLH
jgi:hypothetical protein